MKKRIIALLLALIMLATLAGCSGSNYSTAVKKMEAGSYEEAAKAFAALGSYQDSADKAKECYYKAGVEKLDADDIEGAKELLTLAGDYEGAAAKLFIAEHIFDPDEFMARVSSVLVDNGFDIITFVRDETATDGVFFKTQIDGTAVSSCGVSFQHVVDAQTATTDGYYNNAYSIYRVPSDASDEVSNDYLIMYLCTAAAMACAVDETQDFNTCAQSISGALYSYMADTSAAQTWQENGYEYGVGATTDSSYVYLGMSLTVVGTSD